MTCYYNDSEPFVVAWLINLIAAGHLPAGDVDDRPIQEVQASDLSGYTQCHFFAGIGGWAYALQLTGWGDRPVWTGSCPCQPFSAAGKRGSHADERHLWPAWYDLIRECRPVTVFGEQVSGAAGLGWLDAVALDLEAADYAVGACVLGAHSVGAPHLRQRLYFVADSTGERLQGWSDRGKGIAASPGGLLPTRSGEPRLVADAEQHLDRCEIERDESVRANATGPAGGIGGHSAVGELGESDAGGRTEDQALPRRAPASGRLPSTSSPWDAVEWLPCRDGKARPVEPGTFPLAHGIPGRVGRLRAYGNSICPQTAEAFIRAYLEVTQ